ncbi:MAG: fibronectin type III domain-containing protein, partial [Fimbriimonadales bacterium]|nr:fibronectin type III domain-containing protein [Fimbriimonadales bacterium]
MNAGVTPLPANANNCQVGSSSSCPATSPQEIANLYGTTTNGLYWLNVGGTARQVFVVMDTATSWGSGHWILLMKGARGTSNFGYTSNLFTSNTTVLNEGSPAQDFTSDAKYHAYNTISLSQMLAVIASPERGTISNQGDIANNSFGGHTWLESAGNQTAFTRLTTYSSLNTTDNLAFGSVPVQKYRQNSSGGSTQVFSLQTGTGRYGHANECDPNGYKTRWGIIWNNETNQLGSCDAFVGIGAQSGGLNISPRDQVSYNDSLTFPAPSANNNGGLGQFAFQIWGKMAAPALTAPATPSVVNAGLNQVTVSWTASSGSPTDYVVQYKLNSDSSWGTNPTQSVVVAGTSTTITGLANSTSYDFRVMARTSTNSSSPSAVRTHTITPRTISLNNNGGSGTMATLDVADSVSTTIPANTFTRDRHTFRGWNTAANGTGTSYNSGDGLSAVGGNVTLFAMWTSLDDRAWSKSDLSQSFASRTAEVIPIAQDSAWSIEAWVNMDDLRVDGRWHGLFSQVSNSDSLNDGFEMFLRSDRIYISSASGAVEVVTPVPKNRWVHIAWTWSANDATVLYLDGVQVYYNAAFPRTVSAGSLFTLGGVRRTTEAYEFLGHLDQVKVWN